jgi:hypothetical protein
MLVHKRKFKFENKRNKSLLTMDFYLIIMIKLIDKTSLLYLSSPKNFKYIFECFFDFFLKS